MSSASLQTLYNRTPVLQRCYLSSVPWLSIIWLINLKKPFNLRDDQRFYYKDSGCPVSNSGSHNYRGNSKSRFRSHKGTDIFITLYVNMSWPSANSFCVYWIGRGFVCSQTFAPIRPCYTTALEDQSFTAYKKSQLRFFNTQGDVPSFEP